MSDSSDEDESDDNTSSKDQINNNSGELKTSLGTRICNLLCREIPQLEFYFSEFTNVSKEDDSYCFVVSSKNRSHTVDKYFFDRAYNQLLLQANRLCDLKLRVYLYGASSEQPRFNSNSKLPLSVQFQIESAVANHLFPYILGDKKSRDEPPLINKLFEIFSEISRDELIEIALDTYCREAVRGLYRLIIAGHEQVYISPYVTEFRESALDWNGACLDAKLLNWFQRWNPTGPSNVFTAGFMMLLNHLVAGLNWDFCVLGSLYKTRKDNPLAPNKLIDRAIKALHCFNRSKMEGEFHLQVVNFYDNYAHEISKRFGNRWISQGGGSIYIHAFERAYAIEEPMYQTLSAWFEEKFPNSGFPMNHFTELFFQFMHSIFEEDQTLEVRILKARFPPKVFLKMVVETLDTRIAKVAALRH